MSIRALLLALVLLAIARAEAVAQAVPEITPVVARLAKAYEKAPDGQDFFEIRSLAVDPASGALWIKYGPESEPPVRVDRKTGVAKVIGRKGSGPNEYQRIISMQPGTNGEIGIWDPARQLWFWVDSGGMQRRTWSVPTSSVMQGKVFTDSRGRVYLGQAGPLTSVGQVRTTVVVRLDSAAGFRDTMALPLRDTQRGSWNYRAANSSTGTRVMFSPAVDWGVDRQGRLFAAWTDSNYVIIRDGSKERRLVLPNWREPVTAADKKRATDALDQFESIAKSRDAVFDTPRPAIPGTKPQIASLIAEMNGGIAVRRTRSCGNFPTWRAPITGAPAPADSARCTIVERFDDAGRRLTAFTLSVGDQLLAIRADTAWVARSDSDGLTKILEFVIPRR